MEFKFDGNQDFQLNAISAITDLFEGQPLIEAGLDLAVGGIPVVSNRLDLDDDTLLSNLRAVQETNGLAIDDELKLSPEQTISTADGEVSRRYYNYSVEMETGTGKTYVYLRTALELYVKYGFRKFIIVVPSIAIREGVLKTLQITEKHFGELYGNLPYHYRVYDSDKLTQVRQFALSDSLELMIMTIDAFNKELNVIRQSTDRLGEIPIHLAQATRPILILDEPQTKMEGEQNIRAIGDLCPLMTMRYSATHRNPYNRVYRLSPFDAWRQNLVKRVGVYEVVEEDDFNRAYIEVRKIENIRRKVTATLSVHKLMKSGAVKAANIKVKLGANLFEKTGLPEYQDYRVERIEYGRVVFAVGGRELRLGQGESAGENKDAIFAAQIATAIEAHFRKQRELKAKDIKVLTLFFIDRVANYQNSGKLRRMFDDAFNRLKEQFPEWQGFEAEQVQAAYFAAKRSGEWDDSSSGTAEKDRQAYDLIMRDKERLLSFDERAAFIFSHSALNEGWDNPNIFQICALRDVKSYIRKRQQIGRGLRLPVNQNGDRVVDEHTNLLTVIANERYSQFVQTYQQEIEEEFGKPDAAPDPVNLREQKKVKRTRRFELSPEFKTLWDKIKHKTRYSVNIDSDKVVRDASEDLKRVGIKAARITATGAAIELADDNNFHAVQTTASRDMSATQPRDDLLDLVDRIAYFLEFQSPSVSLSRKTILSIIQQSGRLEESIRNPHAFATQAVQTIKENLADQLVRGIEYERINEWYEMSLFEAEFEAWMRYLLPVEKSVYDHIRYDSDIESKFVKDMENRNDVRLFVKLPSWFVVCTPVGNYNPDWAIVMDAPDNPDGEKLYLVRETKGEGELRPTEQRKTDCGAKHFEGALNVDYRIVTHASELP